MFRAFYAIYLLLLFYIKADCPSWSVDVSNENLCLMPLNQTWDFHTAENFCTYYYSGNVARIDTLFVNVMIQSLAQKFFLQQNVYVGAVRVRNTYGDYNWTWTDGTPLPYQKWDSQQPKRDSNLNCAMMNTQAGYWDSVSCGTPLPAICSFPKNRTQTTTTRQATSTPITGPTTPSWCPNCYPSSDNILFLIDVQMAGTSGIYLVEDLKATLKATLSNWTHFERLAIATYANRYYEEVYYTQMDSYPQALQYLDQIITYSYSPNITRSIVAIFRLFHAPFRAVRLAPLTFQLTATYSGKQKTVLFAQSGGSDDIRQAQPYAKYLEEMGKMTVVVVGGQADNSALRSLATNGSILGWVDTQDPYPLIAFLNAQLET